MLAHHSQSQYQSVVDVWTTHCSAGADHDGRQAGDIDISVRHVTDTVLDLWLRVAGRVIYRLFAAVLSFVLLPWWQNKARWKLISNDVWTVGLFAVEQQQSFYGPLSGTTRMSQYQKKHSPTHHPDHHPNFISFFHVLRSIASSLRALQSFCTTSLHVLLVYLLVWSPPPHIPYISSVCCWNEVNSRHVLHISLVTSSSCNLNCWLARWNVSLLRIMT